jgi:tRNA(Ile)-lysidine synthase
MDLLDQVRETINRHGLLAGGERVVVGVSGGADSVALLYVLHLLKPTLGLRLHVAHLHHGLRPEADQDADFVARIAGSLGQPCTIERADVAALARAGRRSLEEAGRLARYDFFGRVAASAGAAAIAVAHTRDDQVETVLMRLQQGAPWELLAGMRPRRSGPGGAVIRPLRDVARIETRRFLEVRGLGWREDPTNLDLSVPRNRVRHADLPALQSAHPAWPQILWRLGEAAQHCGDVLDRLSNALYGHLRNTGDGGIVIALEALRALPEPLGRRVLRGAASEVTGTSHPLPRVVEDRMWRAVSMGRPGTEVAGHEVALRVGYGTFEIGSPAAALPDIEYGLSVPGEAHAESFGAVFTASIEPRREPSDDAAEAILDAACVEPPLRIRLWRPGDVFRPLGLPGKKKVQDFFVDAKVPRWQRRRTPLVVDARGEIVWVVGHRIAEPCRVRPGTERVLRLRVRSA